MESLTPKKEFIVIARIVRPQGRHGEVLADVLTDFPEKFAERKRLWLGSEGTSSRRDCTLENHWFHKGRVVLKLSGVDSIDDAEKLSGSLVQIPSSERSKLESNAFYVGDLVGSALIDVGYEHPRRIGIVADVQQSVGTAPLLLVDNAERQYEVPFATEYLVRFDASQKTLEMKLPEGLLDVNAPLSDEEKAQQHRS
ncbi:MAG TPA: ribosome maturation factor RimM [Terriglobales bacterium]|nr:ribosome maturation factor RimM [Terriglobales bacterium]